MPTYDYICTSCQNAWELEQRIVEDPVRECPRCGQATAKRQISSGGGFILKGGGWYSDLYSSTKGKADESTAKKDGGESKTSESTTTGAGGGEKSGSGSAAAPAPAASTETKSSKTDTKATAA
jgi:putative FmdB family regulatory protein